MSFRLEYFYRAAFWISLSGLLAFIIDFGFSQSPSAERFLNYFYFFVIGVCLLSTLCRYILRWRLILRKVFVFDLFTMTLTSVIYYVHLTDELPAPEFSIFRSLYWLQIALLLACIREVSELKLNYRRTLLNPAQLFILSFFGIIIIGSCLLLLPNATHQGISLLDAFFTSTSAVCVTGLIVVDTATYFTTFGQTIILILIQTGGLGILTFASYFSYFFKGGTTYENQIVLGDMTSSRKLGEVFSTLKYIILITFGIELVSAALIYLCVDPASFSSVSEQAFFAVFHAVSAFCNAGFSTLSGSLYEHGFRFNYLLHIVIILTFVLGGLGFPIVVNLLAYLRYRVSTLFSFRGRKRIYRPWVLNLNSRITLITTLSILMVAWFLFFILEFDNTLAEHQGFGKVIAALFGAATPRTAGFNNIDTAAMAFPTVMMVFLLMWIGASPQSTGGGIKTSTFAIATLNILSLAKGKARIEIFRREVADVSVRRSFAIISLSLMVIGAGIMFITIFDPRHDLLAIAFECFSAYSTVGLSLGITAQLSGISKLVIAVIMFVGRVSMLSLVIAVFKKTKHKNYSYPKEEITIN